MTSGDAFPGRGRHGGLLVRSVMAVEELVAKLRLLPRGAELLALEPGCEAYCEREVDEVEWIGHRVYLHLGLRRDDQREQDAR